MRHGLSLFLSSDVDIIFLPWSFYYQNNNKVKNILSFSSSKVIERPKVDDKKITSFVCSKIIKNTLLWISKEQFFKENSWKMQVAC